MGRGGRGEGRVHGDLARRVSAVPCTAANPDPSRRSRRARCRPCACGSPKAAPGPRARAKRGTRGGAGGRRTPPRRLRGHPRAAPPAAAGRLGGPVSDPSDGARVVAAAGVRPAADPSGAPVRPPTLGHRARDPSEGGPPRPHRARSAPWGPCSMVEPASDPIEGERTRASRAQFVPDRPAYSWTTGPVDNCRWSITDRRGRGRPMATRERLGSGGRIQWEENRRRLTGPRGGRASLRPTFAGLGGTAMENEPASRRRRNGESPVSPAGAGPGRGPAGGPRVRGPWGRVPRPRRRRAAGSLPVAGPLRAAAGSLPVAGPLPAAAGSHRAAGSLPAAGLLPAAGPLGRRAARGGGGGGRRGPCSAP